MLAWLAFLQAFFSLLMSQSDRMWNAADRVEDSPRSQEEGGLDSKSGLQWEGRGHVPVCSRYGMAAVVKIWTGAGCAGSSGVVRSYHHIRSCWGSAEWEDEGRGEKNLPWCTLLKHAGLQVECGQWGGSCWISLSEALWCGCPAWMNEFKKGNVDAQPNFPE